MEWGRVAPTSVLGAAPRPVLHRSQTFSTLWTLGRQMWWTSERVLRLGSRQPPVYGDRLPRPYGARVVKARGSLTATPRATSVLDETPPSASARSVRRRYAHLRVDAIASEATARSSVVRRRAARREQPSDAARQQQGPAATASCEGLSRACGALPLQGVEHS